MKWTENLHLELNMSCVSLPNQLFLKFTNLLKTMLETYFHHTNRISKHFAIFKFYTPPIFPFRKKMFSFCFFCIELLRLVVKVICKASKAFMQWLRPCASSVVFICAFYPWMTSTDNKSYP